MAVLCRGKGSQEHITQAVEILDSNEISLIIRRRKKASSFYILLIFFPFRALQIALTTHLTPCSQLLLLRALVLLTLVLVLRRRRHVICGVELAKVVRLEMDLHNLGRHNREVLNPRVVRQAVGMPDNDISVPHQRPSRHRIIARPTLAIIRRLRVQPRRNPVPAEPLIRILTRRKQLAIRVRRDPDRMRGELAAAPACAAISGELRRFLHRSTGVRAEYMHVSAIANSELAPAAPVLAALVDAQFNASSVVDIAAVGDRAEELVRTWT